MHLAKLLRKGGNLLLLDEPTNDLDVDTLRALEEALLDFAGCAVVISHDRWFLDRIATHILAFEGDSEVVWFEGNYQDYEADRKRRLGAAADQPHRIKYRKMTRGSGLRLVRLVSSRPKIQDPKTSRPQDLDPRGATMTADQAKAVAEVLGQQIQQEWMTTVKVVEAIPEGKKDWKPAPTAARPGISPCTSAVSDVWFLNGVLTSNFAPGPTGAASADGHGLVGLVQGRDAEGCSSSVLAMDPAKLARWWTSSA